MSRAPFIDPLYDGRTSRAAWHAVQPAGVERSAQAGTLSWPATVARPAAFSRRLLQRRPQQPVL